MQDDPRSGQPKTQTTDANAYLNVQSSGQGISKLQRTEIFSGSLVGYFNHIFNCFMTYPSVYTSKLSSW